MTIFSVLGIELGQEIGAGGFGAVHHSYDPQLTCELAVKVIPRSKFSDQTWDEYLNRSGFRRGSFLKRPAVAGPVFDCMRLRT